MTLVYIVLTLGAITTLYPFVVMFTTSLKGGTDQNDQHFIPTYLTANNPVSGDPSGLLAKFQDDKYATNKDLIAFTQVGTPAPEGIEAELLKLSPMQFLTGFRTAPNQQTGKLAMRYQDWLREKYGTIQSLNRTYIEENVSFDTVAVPSEALDRPGWKPRLGPKWEDWLVFKSQLPAEYRIPLTRAWVFSQWLKGKFKAQIKDAPPELVGSAKSFEEVRLSPVNQGHPLVQDFLKIKAPGGQFAPAPFESMALSSFDTSFVATHAGELKGEFASRNYRYVLRYMTINGRALVNTAIFCTLAILIQLIVNPLAAYTLSRYPMRSTARILTFLLATMAFPAEVAMIPSFLLLKGLGLLNTFAALVLPAAANGYMIYLLKGFFDSLPHEVFESGQLDGAKETTLMLKLAFPMSRPVLGYLALLAFMSAYGSFIYAFLVCQDRRIWTLMVFIYQLQLTAPKAIVMAALTLAAIPTLVVFLLAQKTIMRGIVLPGER